MPMPVVIQQFGHLGMPTELPPEILESASVEVLGFAGGRQFARAADGRELVVGGVIAAFEADNPAKPGEVWVQRIEMVKPEGRPWPEEHLLRIRARVVEAGSFERAQAHDLVKQKLKERRANPGYQLVDALAVIPTLDRKLDVYHLIAGAEYALGGRDAITIRGRSAVRGPRAIIEYLAGKGVRLQATPDGSGVLARATSGRLDPRYREAIRASSRLLAGELTGNPVDCELCKGKQRQPAVTIAEVDVAVCEQHAMEQSA